MPNVRAGDSHGWGWVGALGVECPREMIGMGEEFWVPRNCGRMRAEGVNGDLGAEFWREDTTVDGDGWRALGSERSREDAVVDGDGWELWMPSVSGRPWMGTGGSAEHEHVRVGSLGDRAFAGREDTIIDGMEREDAVIDGDGWEVRCFRCEMSGEFYVPNIRGRKRLWTGTGEEFWVSSVRGRM